MFRIYSCMIIIGLLFSAGARAGNDPIITYQLVPSNPVANVPFELHLFYGPGVFLGDNDIAVTRTGDQISVSVDFFYSGCPPILPCEEEYEKIIPIQGVPPGTYQMRIFDPDSSPPIDESFPFYVGASQAHGVPTLTSKSALCLLGMIVLFSSLVLQRRKRQNR